MAHQSTPRKRGRRSLVGRHQETDAEHDSESDAEYEPHPKLKRPRTSPYTAPPEIVSPSRHQVGFSDPMKMALIHHTIQMQLGDGDVGAGSRENSPLTEEEDGFDEEEPGNGELDEETIQLRAELDARDEEIERLQQKLEEVRRTYVHPDSNQAAAPHRPPSPDPATSVLIRFAPSHHEIDVRSFFPENIPPVHQGQSPA